MSQSLRILVVEEDKQTLVALAMHLFRRQHEVEAARDMQRAVELLNEKHFDIIFSNVPLPLKDGEGWELLDRTGRPKPYSVALSKAGDVEPTGSMSTVDARLVKPFPVQDLDLLLQQAMAR